jgi:hypothetical protein
MTSGGTRLARLQHPSEYRGQTTVEIAASQLPDLTARQQARVLDDWTRFFERGETDIWDLSFPMRMPKRLFDALSTQTQLRRLAVSWGVFDDLTPLAHMTHLIELQIESASSVTDLGPICSLTALESLEIGGAWRVTDYSPIATLARLRQLVIGPGFAEKKLVVDSLEFLENLHDLRLLHLSAIPARMDYSSLLKLTQVEEMFVWAPTSVLARMTPSMLDLEWALPGLRRRCSDFAAGRTYAWRRGERIGDYRPDADGVIALHRYDLADDSDVRRDDSDPA